jgi:hypothetical protein
MDIVCRDGLWTPISKLGDRPGIIDVVLELRTEMKSSYRTEWGEQSGIGV